MTERPVRIAVVGLGERALGTWLPLLLDMSEFAVVGLCDLRPQRMDEARRRYPALGDVRSYASLSEVLADSEVDAVALTVRAENQGALGAEVLEAGKHVHAEVPAAHTIEDCWRIVLAAERTSAVYMLAEQTRYWGFVQEWRRLRNSGSLGDVTYVEGQYFHHLPDDKFVDAHSGDYVPLTELPGRDVVASWQHRMPPIHYLPHELSPMLSVLGDRVDTVVALSTGPVSRAHPDIAQSDMQVALMRTVGGSLVRMAVSFVQPHPEDNWHWYQVIGTKGRVELGRTSRDRAKVWIAADGMHEPVDVDWGFERDDAPEAARGSGHGDADFYAHRAFLDAIHGRPAMDVYTAVETAAPAIVAAKSIALGGTPLRVPDFRPGPLRRRGEDPDPEVARVREAGESLPSPS